MKDADKLSNLKSLLWFLTLLLPLSAQAAGPITPNAGSILQQVQPILPQAPSSNGTGLKIEREGKRKLPPSTPFEMKVIQILGNTLFDTKTLHALVADAEGKTITLADLDELATRITNYYHDHGYPLARAFIPAQTIQDGLVRIEIIEARYGNVKIDNHSKVKNKLLEATLGTLKIGHAIEQAEMDHALLLLSDIPGIKVNATLEPGEKVGTSDLMVETTPGPAVTGNLTMDNYGGSSNGLNRVGGTVNFNNPLHYGDVLSVNGLSTGSGTNYGRLSYESLLNGQGARMGGSYSALHYILGGALAPLQGHGTAGVASLWGKQPFVRTPNLNLNGQLQYDQKELRDHIDAAKPPSRTDRHLDNWTASLSGDNRDSVLSGGVNTWNLALTSGRIGFEDATAQSNDAKTAKTQGSFLKFNMNLFRLQSLSARNSFYFNFFGQWANTNLDGAEKMGVGGPYTVRAYNSSVSGDAGYFLISEFRRDLGQVWHGQWQMIGFVDTSHVTVNKKIWTAGTNSATLTGAGVGLNWFGPNLWTAKTCIAAPVGSTSALVGPTSSVRGWIEIGKGF